MNITHTTNGNKRTVRFHGRDYNGTESPFDINIYVDIEPTANCQLYSISCAYAMIYLTQEETRQLLNYINTTLTSKRMLLVDLQKFNLKQFKKQFSPFMSSMKVSHYKSSNGSDMCIVVSQINTNLLRS